MIRIKRFATENKKAIIFFDVLFAGILVRLIIFPIIRRG